MTTGPGRAITRRLSYRYNAFNHGGAAKVVSITTATSAE
jgi:hypothetical protein